MWKSENKILDVTKLSGGHFSLQAVTQDGEILPPDSWQRHLLLWHKESFHGTMLKKHEEAHVYSVVLDSWSILTLFAQPSFHGRITWDLSPSAQFYYDAAPLLFEWITEGKWLEEWHGKDARDYDQFNMTLSDDFWEEWRDISDAQMEIGEEDKEHFNDWYQQAITYFFEHNHRSRGLVKRIFNENHALTAADLATYFDEEKWSDWVQEKDLASPYRFGIRFEEPMSEDGLWTMQPFLRDQRRADWTYDLKLSVPLERSLPDRWKKEKEAIEQELSRWVRLIPYLKDEGVWQTEMSEERAWLFLTEGSQKLLALDVEILLPSWWKSIQQSNVALKAAVKGDHSYRPSFVGLDALVEYDWKVSINGSDMTDEEFDSLVNEKRRFIQINGDWIALDPALIARIQRAMETAKKRGIRMRDLLEQELDQAAGAPEDVIELDDLRIQYELNRSMKSMLDSLNDVGQIPLIEPPAGLEGTLRPYQQQGFSWMHFLRTNRFGACLADDMGLGKTIQLISYMLHVKATEKLTAPFLIVCPTSVLGNWQREIERFAPSLKLHLHYGPSRHKEESFHRVIQGTDIVLTSYGLCHADQEELTSVQWSAVALDEAQNIKNPHTKQSKAIRKLEGMHHLALTGTPMENRLSELWAIFDFINHGYLGTLSSFRQQYIVPIERDSSELLTRKLQGRIRPFLLRRTKNDPAVGLNLPSKIEQKEFCPLTTEQASLYEQLVKDTLEKIPTLSGIERKGMVLQMLNRLKQLCDHPALFLGELDPEYITERSEKMLKLMDLVEQIMDAKEGTIIFTQYISMGNMIKQVLEEQYGVTVPFLNGSTPKNKRDEMVEQFQNGSFPIFILSLKAGGTGLTLTAANHVIHYDRWWNPAVENQATDRAYRIGQTRFVHVHKFISSGTVEEKIDLMLEKKQSLNEEIIKGDQWITELTNEELEDLLVLSQ
ncbi:DEAD/DEAH box helicase [Jeotgalibacillus proteolyticus]|uniref:ATP-dependent helicase n=1 Tax=Jeotgalibacillus proteolyticus TaxID=2082395 RepID=A0A2S5G971_9BACL|nr:DEAD/DEAH box helicase [Jeotgalibacillus proteolyticus]PPA69552.1 ATP-dependent helicase [Jeotgalibacillus proteolyticus]